MKTWLMAAGIMLAGLLFMAAPAHAQGTANNCCTFKIGYTSNIDADCLPITVTTSWGGVTQNDATVAPGPTTYNISGTCPPVPATFDWFSLDGGTTQIPFNTNTTLNISNGNCQQCLLVLSHYDAAGCIHINLWGIPCP